MLAKLYGGRRQPGSGNLPGAPHDVKTARFLFEAKTTKHGQYPLKLKALHEFYENALKRGLIPVFTIQFEDKESYMVLRKEDFTDMAFWSS